MLWFEDQLFLVELAASPTRTRWAEDVAANRYYHVVENIPKALRNKSRMGPLGFGQLEGTEGIQCWMIPLEGGGIYQKLLGHHHRIKLFDNHGKILFDGIWGETTRETILAHEELYVWLEPPEHPSYPFG